MIKELFSDSSGSYLRITGDSDERTADTILRKNCIRGLLPVEIERVNDRQEYVYEVSGFQSLNEYMEDHPLQKKQWNHLWEQVMETAEELENYLLDGEHLLIDGDCLFVRGEGPEAACVYLPKHRQALGKSICEVTEKALRYPEADADTSKYLYRLHDETAVRKMTRRELRDLIREDTSETEECKPVKSVRNPGVFSGMIESVHNKQKKSGNSEEEKNKRYKILSLGMVAAGILLPTVLLRFGVFTSSVTGQINLMTLGLSYSFFLAAAGYGFWALWPRKSADVVWDQADDLSVCLIPKTIGLKIMPVMRFPWQIGRDGGKTDAVLDREDISPVHARIQRESESIFLIDEETISGTYINDKRLTPWEKTRVQDGDTITFGTASFVVEIIR